MTTIHDAYINALLSDATYALEDEGPYSSEDLKVLVDLKTRMTPTQAKYIGDSFSVLTHVESDDFLGSGLMQLLGWQKMEQLMCPCKVQQGFSPRRADSFTVRRMKNKHI
jgi:hypothetical protein